MTIKSTNNEQIQSVNSLNEEQLENGFYMLSPDGFTLSPDAKKYTSIENAKSDFDIWIKIFETQGYYSTPNYGRIPLEDVWDYMILHTMPFFSVNL